MTESPSPPRLLFAWERAHQFRWALLGFIVLSLFAHVATFFLFGITYPQRVTIPPAAPEISLLLPTTPENRSLLRRIEAEDPALVAAPTSVVPPNLPEVKYRPSYESRRAQPQTVPEEPITAQFPPPKDPLDIIRSSSPRGVPATAAPPPQPTRTVFSEALQGRAPKQEASWQLDPPASAPLEPATFLIGVSDRGEVRYVFLQRSSGNAAVDRQTAAQLPHLDFAEGSEPVTWGLATITWGDDAYAKGAPAQAKATRP